MLLACNACAMPPIAKFCATAMPPSAAFHAIAQPPNTCQPNANAPSDQSPKLNPPSESNPTAQPPKDNNPIGNAPMLTGAIARLPKANNKPTAYSPEAIQALTGITGTVRPPLTRTWMKGSPNKIYLLRYSHAGLAGFAGTPFALSSARNLRGPRSQKIPLAKIMKVKGSTNPIIKPL